MIARIVGILFLVLLVLTLGFVALVENGIIRCQWDWCGGDHLEIVSQPLTPQPTQTPQPIQRVITDLAEGRAVLELTVEVLVIEITREVPVEVTREVPVEVTREIPVEVTREVQVEVTREVPVEVTREVPVEVTREVVIEVTSEPSIPTVSSMETCQLLVLDYNSSSVVYVLLQEDVSNVYYLDKWYETGQVPEMMVSTTKPTHWLGRIDEDLVVLYAQNLLTLESAMTVFNTSDKSNWGTIYHDPDTPVAEDWPSILVYPERWCLGTYENTRSQTAGARRISLADSRIKTIPYSLSLRLNEVSCQIGK